MPAAMSAAPAECPEPTYRQVIFIEQNFGPHIEQKCATLCASFGSVSSWKARAVSGSSAEVELVLPAELEARRRQRVVAQPARRVALGEVGGVRGDLVGDDADLDVVAVGQAEMLLRRDVAEHRRAEPADHRRADAPR
jgi:hypothetical protein